jgi:flagellar motility protein MotE (MotC chaperone)
MAIAMQGSPQRRLIVLCLAGILTVAPRAAVGMEEAGTQVVAAREPASDAEKFCANIGDAAADARLAWEARTLNELKTEIEEKTAALEAKRTELEDWVKRREEFRKLAEETIVDIYAKMRPDAAAAQLAALEPETAAAVLMKLKSRVAGAILAEMETRRAVSLAALISTGARGPGEGATQQ